MTEVFTVTHDLQYSHSHLLGVFSSEENALEFCKAHMAHDDASNNLYRWNKDSMFRMDESLNIESITIDRKFGT